MPAAKTPTEKRPPEGGQGQSSHHVAAWPLYSTAKNETVTSSERHTVLVPWESLAVNLGGGGHRFGNILKSDWVTGSHKTKSPQSLQLWARYRYIAL